MSNIVVTDEDTEDEDEYYMKEVLKSGPKGKEIVIDLTDTKSKGEVKAVVARCVIILFSFIWLYLVSFEYDKQIVTTG